MYAGPPLAGTDDLPSLAKKCQGRTVDVDHVAKLLADGSLVGVVQGSREIGLPSLGHRSFLSWGLAKQLQETPDNKRRYRVPTVVVPVNVTASLFGRQVRSPNSFALEYWTPGVLKTLPPACHREGQVLVQTLKEDENPWLWMLLWAVGQRLLYPALLMSNLRRPAGEHIESVDDAFTSFQSSFLDYLLIESFLFDRDCLKSLKK